MKLSTCLSMLIAGAFVAGPAAAGPLALHINSSDLNLSTSEGVEALRVRVVSAVNQLCDPAALADYRGGIDKIGCVRSIRISPEPVARLVKLDSGLVQLVRESDRKAARGMELANR